MAGHSRANSSGLESAIHLLLKDKGNTFEIMFCVISPCHQHQFLHALHAREVTSLTEILVVYYKDVIAELIQYRKRRAVVSDITLQLMESDIAVHSMESEKSVRGDNRFKDFVFFSAWHG